MAEATDESATACRPLTLLTEEESIFQAAREFAEKEIGPHVAAYEGTSFMQLQTIAKVILG